MSAISENVVKFRIFHFSNQIWLNHFDDGTCSMDE